MRQYEQIIDELKALSLFDNFSHKKAELEALAGILFEDESILHIFLCEFATNSSTQSGGTDYLAVCTNERIIFAKNTIFDKIKSEIFILKNAQSFEYDGQKIIRLKILDN